MEGKPLLEPSITTEQIATMLSYIANRVVSWNIAFNGEIIPVCSAGALPIQWLITMANAISSNPDKSVIKIPILDGTMILLIVRQRDPVKLT